MYFDPSGLIVDECYEIRNSTDWVLIGPHISKWIRSSMFSLLLPNDFGNGVDVCLFWMQISQTDNFLPMLIVNPWTISFVANFRKSTSFRCPKRWCQPFISWNLSLTKAVDSVMGLMRYRFPFLFATAIVSLFSFFIFALSSVKIIVRLMRLLRLKLGLFLIWAREACFPDVSFCHYFCPVRKANCSNSANFSRFVYSKSNLLI